MNLLRAFRTASLACVLALCPTVFSTASAFAQASTTPDYVLVSSPLILSEKTAVPSKVLGAGKYSIRIIDRISDRYILRIDDENGKTMGTFIGLHDADLSSYVLEHHEGPIVWPTTPKGSAVTMRGFSFPNGNTLEFAYPKTEAVALAKANGYSVVAVDPESEGRKPDPKLSLEDREVVTLWMLTPTRIGKQQTPAMEAKRYVPPPTTAPTESTTLLARNEPPRELPPAQPSVPAAVTDAVAAPVRLPKARTRAFAAKLPQTGSNLPFIALLSGMMLAAALSVRAAHGRA